METNKVFLMVLLNACQQVGGWHLPLPCGHDFTRFVVQIFVRHVEVPSAHKIDESLHHFAEERILLHHRLLAHLREGTAECIEVRVRFGADRSLGDVCPTQTLDHKGQGRGLSRRGDAGDHRPRTTFLDDVRICPALVLLLLALLEPRLHH